MEEKRSRGRPPTDVRKVQNTGRQPMISLAEEIFRKLGLLPAYARGEIFCRVKVTYDYKNPLNTDVRLRFELKPELCSKKEDK